MSIPNQPIPPTTDIAKTQASATAQGAQMASVVQEEMQESFQGFLDQFSVNTMQIIRRNSEPLEERVKKKNVRADSPQKSESEVDEEIPMEVEAAEEISGYYENRNPEVKAKTLQSLKDQISKFDTAEDILQKILENFPDPVMADAAYEYLLQVMPDELKAKINESRTNFEKRFGRSLKAGKNVFEDSLKFAKEGLAPPSELRQVYSELTGDPLAPLDLFEQLLRKFTFEKMKQAIDFWLSALGSDLNSKGSSIERGELHKLIDETRTLQAILGVYRYFGSKQRELVIALVRKNQQATAEMGYQNLAKVFVKTLQDKFPSPDKIINLKYELNIAHTLHAQEAVINVMCSAIKGVAPRLFRNQKHKDEILNCYLMALEAIDSVISEQS